MSTWQAAACPGSAPAFSFVLSWWQTQRGRDNLEQVGGRERETTARNRFSQRTLRWLLGEGSPEETPKCIPLRKEQRKTTWEAFWGANRLFCLFFFSPTNAVLFTLVLCSWHQRWDPKEQPWVL